MLGSQSVSRLQRISGVRAALLGFVGVVLATSSCTQATDGKPNAVFVTTTIETPTTTKLESSTDQGDPSLIRQVCPTTVSVQLDGPIDFWTLPWIPLVAIDGPATAASYQALMVDPDTREPTGITIELRTGSAPSALAAEAAEAAKKQKEKEGSDTTVAGATTLDLSPSGNLVFDRLASDPSLLFGVSSTEFASSAPAKRVRFVLAPWERDDRILVWDRASFPQAMSVVELGDVGKVDLRADPNEPFAAYLIASGLFGAKNVRADKTGVTVERLLDTPARASESLGERNWQFLDETGWTPYPHAIATTDAGLARWGACVEQMVPMLQRSMLAVRREPERFAANLTVIASRVGNPVDPATLAARIRAADDSGILGDGSNDTLGDLQRARLGQMLRAAEKAGQRVSIVTIPAKSVDKTVPELFARFWNVSLGTRGDDERR